MFLFGVLITGVLSRIAGGGFGAAVYCVFNNSHSVSHNVKAVSTTAASLRVFREVTTGVLLGGSITPSSPLASTAYVVVAKEF